MKDPTLGIIFKPSYPHTIYQRLSPISGLLEAAKKTGRCAFIDEGKFKSDKLPTEIAQASDVAVGLLLSGTAALESSLSGAKTVFLNLEKVSSIGLGPADIGNVVFNSLEELFLATDLYRNGGTDREKFGNLSHWVGMRDTHRDGRATFRMGRFINALLMGLDRGEDPDTVLERLKQEVAC
ncbi:MAG: hypothetical protein IPP35_08655 [Elusimicrobia bacterium]|nr:hypothetical protein [Elusimicrobiota bacterium]